MEGNNPLPEGIDTQDSTYCCDCRNKRVCGNSLLSPEDVSPAPSDGCGWLPYAGQLGRYPTPLWMSSGAIRYSQKRLPQQIKSASLINIFT